MLDKPETNEHRWYKDNQINPMYHETSTNLDLRAMVDKCNEEIEQTDQAYSEVFSTNTLTNTLSNRFKEIIESCNLCDEFNELNKIEQTEQTESIEQVNQIKPIDCSERTEDISPNCYDACPSTLWIAEYNNFQDEYFDKKEKKMPKVICETCMYFIKGFKYGQCRYDPSSSVLGGYPVMANDDYCGHHKFNMLNG